MVFTSEIGAGKPEDTPLCQEAWPPPVPTMIEIVNSRLSANGLNTISWLGNFLQSNAADADHAASGVTLLRSSMTLDEPSFTSSPGYRATRFVQYAIRNDA